MAKNKKEVTKMQAVGSSQLATPGKIVRGFEAEVDKSDIIIPRAKLIQKMSDEVSEDFKEGQIINSITKEILPATFIPIFVFKEYLRFDESKKLMWRTTDPKDPRVLKEAAFGENGEVPLAHTYLNFFAMFDGLLMPIIVGFSKSSYKVGKQLLSLARFSGTDMFGRKYTLGSKKVQGDKGAYAVFTVNPAGIVTEDEYKTANQLWETYSSKAKDIQIHNEVVEDSSDLPDCLK